MLRSGTHLGPYEVLSLLGAGGMGEVYRARDTRLGRDVAIKVLPAEFAADPDRLSRFEQEARAVAALNHPNIVAIHDIGTHEGAPYIVSELLEGESLRERLISSPLPPRKAMELAVQIAQGLAAAHAKGIIHRDLKPENLFVTRDGQAKILDFGVAKLAPKREQAERSVAPTVLEGTDPGIVMGTAGYMSPEQVRGLSVDQRSDIFSLGCVLYEMVTGRRAFARATAADTMAAILTQEPPELSSIDKVIPAPLSRAIAHCLEKQPEERFQSARDLAFELRAVLADTGGALAKPGLTGIPGRRIAVLAAGGIAIVLIAAGAFFVLRATTRKPSTTLDPKRIVVAVFENQTGDSSLDPLGRMASDWITQGLSRIPSVEAISTSAAIQAERGTTTEGRSGRRRDPLLVLAEETGAGTVVSGTYYLQGPNLQFQARVTDASSGTLVYALEPIAGTREDPMKALDALQQRVMGVIASRFDARFSFGVGKPPLFEAYREYVAGLELFGEDYTQAIRHFQKAAEIDPEFESPQLYIAISYGNQGDFTKADAIIRRLSENRERLTPLERALLDWYRASLAGHDAEALKALLEAQKLAPKSSTVAYIVGLEALNLNLPQQTVDTYAKHGSGGLPSVRTIPGSWWFSVLAGAHHMLSSYEKELEVANQTMKAFPDLLTVRRARIRALAALGRVEELNRTIDESLAVSSRAGTPDDLMLQASWELRAHGNRQAAVQLATRAVDWLRTRPPAERTKEKYPPAMALALYSAQRWGKAQVIYQELATKYPVASGYAGPREAQTAREDAPENLRLSRAIDYLGALGALAARRGDRGEAMRISDELARIDRPFLYGTHTYWRACIAALLGEKQQAVDLLRESFAQGNVYTVHLHRDMDLEPLWDHPQFVELLRPKG